MQSARVQEKYRYDNTLASDSFQKALHLCWDSAKTGSWPNLSACCEYYRLSNYRSAQPATAQLLAEPCCQVLQPYWPWWGVQFSEPASLIYDATTKWIGLLVLTCFRYLTGCLEGCGKTCCESKQMPFLKTDTPMGTANSGLGVQGSEVRQTL